MEKYFDDKELGRVIIKLNPRAKSYSVKIKNGEVYAVMPECGNIDYMLSFILKNKGKIKSILDNQPKYSVISENSVIKTASFQVNIYRCERENFYMSLKNGILNIACPNFTDFNRSEIQEILNNMLISAMRHEAKRLLPQRALTLARKFGFSFKQIKINSSKSRWGSCSTSKNINLSLFLMRLPWHLIDYVILHELCHTIEMNHSDRFWALMDKVTDNKAKDLRTELKGISINSW